MSKETSTKVARDPDGRLKKGVLLNADGRPRKGETLTDLMRAYLDQKEVGHELTRKQELVQKIAAIAYKGDLFAIKLIWAYLDGMPKQTITVDTEDSKINVLGDIIDKLSKGKTDGIITGTTVSRLTGTPTISSK